MPYALRISFHTMTEFVKRKTTRYERSDYSTAGAYFLTICTRNRRPILSHITVGTGVPDGPFIEPDDAVVSLLPYGKIAEKYIHQLNDFYEHITVDAYVIMPNHIHLIILVKYNGHGPSRTPVPTRETQAPQNGFPVSHTVQNSVVSRFVSTFKRFCNKEIGENIWQYRSNDHIIRNRKDYDEHIRYIFENPFRWHYDTLYTEED